MPGENPERKARHSRPSNVDSTGPRKYKSDCCGGAPLNRTRMAMLSSNANLAMLPTCMLADRPLRPLIASPGTPHSGAMRGNSTNSTAITGAPSRAIQPAVLAACSSGGLPTGMWVLTSAVNSPSRAINMAAATKSDCEKKKFVSIVKKLKKKITNASRLARSSSVFRASRITINVTPASRPNSVRWVKTVAATVTTSSASSHQREGSGLEK